MLGLTHLSVLLCMHPSMQPHIQNEEVPVMRRLNICVPIPLSLKGSAFQDFALHE
jgi:hypothetical protein